jgi:hypothetical protein
MTDIVTAAECAARAELGWRDASGDMHAIAFTPLVIDGTVAVALPFDRAATAHAIGAATEAVLVLSDSRMAWRGWSPWAQPVRPDVVADRKGDWTWTGALDQEVRKFPPSQLLIDTPIQRREHWWYVPRWIIRLRPAGAAASIARRGGPDDAVLLAMTSGELTAQTVAVDDWHAHRVRLTALDSGAPLERTAPTPALLFTHDFSIPTMDRLADSALAGTQQGTWFEVTARHGSPALGRPLGLIKRLSGHWHRERDCRRALADYDAVSSAAAT